MIFFSYYREHDRIEGIEDIDKYRHHIILLAKKLERSNFLCYAGREGYSMGGEIHYYFCKELSEIEKSNTLWLGECVGIEYIWYKIKNFIVPVTGIDSNGSEAIGTGALINSNTILTCQHVLNDMKINDSVMINGNKIKVKETYTHDLVDVGLIKIVESVDMDFQIVFGEASTLDEIVTMGYPPVPMTKDAYLISQKGEINSFVEDYHGIEHFVYSAVTRPGNSGGPVFSKRGHLCGMSIRHLEDETNKGKNVLPFYEAICSKEIIKALIELEPNIKYLYEDYD